ALLGQRGLVKNALPERQAGSMKPITRLPSLKPPLIRRARSHGEKWRETVSERRIDGACSGQAIEITVVQKGLEAAGIDRRGVIAQALERREHFPRRHRVTLGECDPHQMVPSREE